MSNYIYLYTKWVRVWHLTNAILCLLLIISGLGLQYAGLGHNFMRFDISVSLHNISAILLTASYIIFFVGNIVTGNGKYYKMGLKPVFKNVMIQGKYYTIGVFKGQKPPFPVNKENKFNPLQKLSYIVVMYLLMPVMFLTGWALLFPEMVLPKIFGWSGLHMNDLLHIFSGYLISLFMFVHIYFCTFGATAGSNFKTMVTGWYREHK